MSSQDSSPGVSLRKTGGIPFVGRSVSWLFSQHHFQLKLLSGTAVGVAVIVFLSGLFLFLTYRNHRHEEMRGYTLEVIHLTGEIANDISGLEAAHRGFLLSGKPFYEKQFNETYVQINKRLAQLIARVTDSLSSRKRVVAVQTDLRDWVNQVAAPSIAARKSSNSLSVAEAPPLGSDILQHARDTLQSVMGEQQASLSERMRDQEWSAQSIQILDYIPKLERSVSDMEKEERAFVLTGSPGFEENFKNAEADFNTAYNYLSVLVANMPGQPEVLHAIRQGADRWISEVATPRMEARQSGGNVNTMLLDEKAEQLSDALHDSIASFGKGQLQIYAERAAAAKQSRILKTTAVGLLCSVAAVLLIVSSAYSFVLCRRQLEKLEAAEARIRSIIDNILDGMITVDEQGVICSMNPAAEKMFGCINNEMIGHNFVKLVPKTYGNEPDAQPVPCAWSQIAKRTGSTTLAVGRTRKHATFPVDISLSQMLVDEKKLYVAMIRDVTERKRFEQELAAEKESLAVTLRSIGDGVITTDVSGKIIMINNAAEALTGFTSAEGIGQPLKAIFNITIDATAQARAQRSGYRSEAHSLLLSLPENATLRSKNGTERIIEQVASPIRDTKNEVAGVVLVFRDITERQRVEVERRKAETLEQLGLLAGGIAHDFNNLLTAIIGNISLASLMLPPDNEMNTRLSDAKNASMRARDLAQQLLTFSRGGAPIKKTASIGRLIQDTVSFSLRGTNSRSEFQFGDDLWAAEIDPGQISQVIANLAVNADQAMPNGGTLKVSCDNFVYDQETVPQITDLAPGDYIRIRIHDQGVGIPEHYLKRIFDPYFTTKQKGNGLGLATSYSIVKNHEGLITVDSEVHRGSTFTIYLPAVKNVETPVEVTPATTQEISGTGRILIVDDEEAIRALVEFTLSRLGYEVVGAESALEGVNFYREALEKGQRFDLVILDLTLPGGMGGKEALKKLMELDPTVNAIVSSGYAMDATMSRYQDYGFRGVIAKPYEAAELGRVVRDVIAASAVNIVEDFEGGRLATRVA